MEMNIHHTEVGNDLAVEDAAPWEEFLGLEKRTLVLMMTYVCTPIR